MPVTDLIFDLYGTLVDIHTEESDLVWEKCALFFRFHGAPYTADALQKAFRAELRKQEAKEGQSYECFPDIPFEQVLAILFRQKGVTEQAESLAFSAAQLFRICSMEYLRLYPGVLDALAQLRKAGFRLHLLSNAQRVFTAYELQSLGLGSQFDSVYISSDYRCRKPDARFYDALLHEQGLKAESCMMVGNDRMTDILGAKNLGMATFYMHTALTPADQPAADPALHPNNAPAGCRHFEFEGDDWAAIAPLLLKMRR